ncbi:sugar phosphate isomerase/epimerase [Actinoplanes bogorensis]|uniref:Sugar phosphate isomerase/epimerase n=1 Tax=Paractinoplanes bogorensis TaxID=1610840 RepID=A0ABS5YYH5_9ACTN|nr:sugar phosphate isomerase/epimerase [Actinoplanes bogorensis]MBU2668487.1 sugar phosphate isomerase/epimerase [Actinoplanes bogorensis]
MDNNVSRRTLLGAGAGVLATGALATTGGAAMASPKHGGGSSTIPADRIGLQIFTVRELIGTDFKNLEIALEAVHDAGVRELELAGTYYEKTTTQLKALVQSYGLRIVSNHFGPRGAGLPNPWATHDGRMQIFEDAQKLGRFPYVGTGSAFGFDGGGFGPFTGENMKVLADQFNKCGEHAVKQGFGGFFFHNHDSEFKLENGSPIFNILLERTDPRYVKFEVDLGWVSVAGEDPYWWIKKHGKRFIAFHIKDIKWDPNGNRTAAAGTRAGGKKFRFVDVGKGDVDWTRTLSALNDLRDYRFFLEHDDAGNLALNPPGSANTVWRGCSALESIKTRRK